MDYTPPSHYEQTAVRHLDGHAGDETDTSDEMPGFVCKHFSDYIILEET